MTITCTRGCGLVFDDAIRDTVCPHPELIGPYATPETEEGKQLQKMSAEIIESYLASIDEPDWALEVNESLKAGGNLWVGLNVRNEVVINHPLLDADKDGIGHIVFSPQQARNLATLLLTHARAAEQNEPLKITRRDFRAIEMSLAYQAARDAIECCDLAAPHENSMEDFWYNLKPDRHEEMFDDEVAYLESRRLLQRHPEHPEWVTILDEGEPLPEEEAK